jgi:serine/threonine-protein phosphatase 6 regulatory ankyrin repeat subunit B
MTGRLTIAMICFLAALASAAQNTPDPMIGPLQHPIEELRANPRWRVFAAVITHDHEALQAFLKSGDSPNTPSDYRRLPLATACQLGDLEAVKILVQGGAAIDQFGFGDEDALMASIKWGHPEITRYLIAQGAPVNVRRKSDGATALFFALGRHDFDTLNLLIQAGADINLAPKSGDTPMLVAARNDDVEMVEFLKSKGARFASPSEELLFAASHGDVALIQRTLAAGANINQAYEYGVTPLMAAALKGQSDAVKCLLAAGANVNARDQIHATALVYAIKSGNKPTILAPLDAGADPTIEDVAFETALDKAAIYLDDPEIVRRLIARGLPKSAGDTISVTPLMYAAAFGHIRTVEILLEADVPINLQSREGLTALIQAATSGRPEIVTLLLDHGADASIKDQKGMTALDHAIKMGQHEVIAILVRQLPPSSGTAPAPVK